jgi:hypothetical protein
MQYKIKMQDPKLGMVVNVYSQVLERRRWGGSWFQVSLCKKVRPHQ